MFTKKASTQLKNMSLFANIYIDIICLEAYDIYIYITCVCACLRGWVHPNNHHNVFNFPPYRINNNPSVFT